jgi:hypothetical protein
MVMVILLRVTDGDEIAAFILRETYTIYLQLTKNKTMKTLGRIFYYAQRVTLVAFPAYFIYRILLYCYAGI